MKIVRCDLYGKDHEPEILIAVNLSEDDAIKVINVLNDQSYYYKIVDDDYVLDLQSMLDVIDSSKEENYEHYLKCYGIKSILFKENKDYILKYIESL